MPEQEDPKNINQAEGDEGEGTVEISKSDFQALIQGQKELQQQINDMGGERVQEIPTISEREVTILYVDESPVIGFANKGTEDKPSYVYMKRDPDNPTNRVAYVTALLYQGKDEDGGLKDPRKLEVEYADLLRNANKRDHKIVEKSSKPWSERQGKVRKKDVDGYAMVEKEYIVPLVVKGETYVYEIELEDGEPLKIHEKWVNLA